MASEKVTLVICDGMGLSPEINGNAIIQAATPTLDYLLQNYPAMRLLAAGSEVGLDLGEPGNSEVGHMTIGTGQVLPQAFQVINGSIKSEGYKSNKVLLQMAEEFKADPTKTLHIIGLVSSGGVHGHINHMIALLRFAKDHNISRVAIHAITDGRDTPPQVALSDIAQLYPYLSQFELGKIATIGGRYFAMDRDQNWERTDAYYWPLLGRFDHQASTLETAVNQGYERGQSDENLQPTVIVNADQQPIAPIQAGDTVLFTNYRPDRIRQLATRIITSSIPLTIVTLTDYFLGDIPATVNQDTKIMSAYPLPKPQGTFSQVVAKAGKSQLHIAETEKYAHITYFFNGHAEEKNPLEEWLLVPSPKVDSFDRVPEMSAQAITQAYLNAQHNHPTDFTTLNYANLDMIGHTGNFEATQQAVTLVDTQLKLLVEWAEEHGSWLAITADHGNAEQMVNPITGEIDKEHTTNPVPFILIHSSLKRPRGGDKSQLATISQVGILADVAPTLLEILNLKPSAQMVGTSLLHQLIDN